MAKIMLVEDDKSLREIYSIRLVAEGYNIVSAGDGEEALGLAVHEKPDLIIADVMMPKISGFDMLDILRSTPETSKIKVIMMTALGGEEQRRRGEQLGAERYLVKSQVGIEDVINAVHEVLGDKANAGAHANLDTVAAIPAKEAGAADVAPQAVAPQMDAGQVVQAAAAQAMAAPTPVAAEMTQPAAAQVQVVATQPASTAAPAPQTVPNMPTTSTSPANQATAQANAAPSTGAGVSERIIQPIHDPRLEKDREEMQKKMVEILGEENTTPRAVTTETAEELTRAAEEQAKAAAAQAKAEARAKQAAEEAAQKAAEQAQKLAAEQQAAAAAQATQAQLVQAAQTAAKASNVAPIQPAYEIQLRDQLAEESEVDPQNPIAVKMANALKEETVAANSPVAAPAPEATTTTPGATTPAQTPSQTQTPTASPNSTAPTAPAATKNTAPTQTPTTAQPVVPPQN